MKPTPKLFAILAATVIAALPALARGGDHGPGPGFGPPHEGGMFHMARALDLTEDQQAKIRDITKTYMDGDLGTRLDAVHEARKALGKLVHDPAATDDAITQAAQAVGTAQGAFDRARKALFDEGISSSRQPSERR